MQYAIKPHDFSSPKSGEHFPVTAVTRKTQQRLEVEWPGGYVPGEPWTEVQLSSNISAWTRKLNDEWNISLADEKGTQTGQAFLRLEIIKILRK